MTGIYSYSDRVTDLISAYRATVSLVESIVVICSLSSLILFSLLERQKKKGNNTIKGEYQNPMQSLCNVP